VQNAFLAGIESHRAGFPESANPYADNPFMRVTASWIRDRGARLREWAFDLGWRERDRITRRLCEIVGAEK